MRGHGPACKEPPRRPPWWLHGPLKQFHYMLVNLEQKLEILMATNQEQLDAIAAEVGTIRTDLTAGFDGLSGDIDRLEQQVADGQPADFTALRESLAGVRAVTDALKTLDDRNQEPAPEPEPEV